MKSLSGLLLMVVLSGFSTFSCSKWDRNDSIDRQDIVLTKAQQDVLDRSQVFAIDFFKEMGKEQEKGNLFVSPLSLSLALSAVTNGAEGSTQEQMKAVLGFQDFSLEQMNGFYKKLIPALQKADRQVTLHSANAVWIEKAFPVKKPFLDALQHYYKASVNKLDFRDGKAPGIINKWCKDNTNGMIPEIIDRVDPSYKLFYTNALYFKGDWKSTFDKKHSQEGLFRNGTGQASEVVFMEQTQTFPYYEEDRVALAEFPYGNEAFSMVIALPAEGVTAEECLQSLTLEKWHSWMESLSPVELHVRMPRFELEYDSEDMMIPVLSRMGMDIAFDGSRADFSNISDIPLFIDLIKQNARIKVDEKGTEAAAVTIIGVRYTSIGPAPVPFYIDRPFILFIKEKSTGTLLFTGLVREL
ncbi:MAG: serpin family protein [Bacteroidales bacterium]|jgi:serine protease inhibitor|nr:serpin family protein [Bacteroidales bacterium]HHV39777.1 serpin family protein [Bacteroidales bacterium]